MKYLLVRYYLEEQEKALLFLHVKEGFKGVVHISQGIPADRPSRFNMI